MKKKELQKQNIASVIPFYKIVPVDLIYQLTLISKHQLSVESIE
jgi:hypothetical protein